MELTRVDDRVELSVTSSLVELQPQLLRCEYARCEVAVRAKRHPQILSSLECSAFAATLNDCLRCEEMTCETDVDAPFGDLFQEIETPMVFACDGQRCVWRHDQLFTQAFHCLGGTCVKEKIKGEELAFIRKLTSSNVVSGIIMGAFALLLVALLRSGS